MKTKQPLEKTIRLGLDRRTQRLDAHTLSRLRQARAAALAGHGQRAWYQRFEFPAWALPAGGLAALCGIAVGLLVWLQPSTQEFQLQALARVDTVLVEMAEAELDIELIEEIEFYDWLMLAQANGDSL